MEAEVEASIAATNAECEAESGTRTGRMSCRAPNLSRVSQWSHWYARHPFAGDLVGCAETNS